MNSNSWNLRQLFGLMDKNQDGVIDVQDLAAICTSPDTLPVDQVNVPFIVHYEKKNTQFFYYYY
jgi:Ca2+-binding EF-hand superfamily protein